MILSKDAIAIIQSDLRELRVRPGFHATQDLLETVAFLERQKEVLIRAAKQTDADLSSFLTPSHPARSRLRAIIAHVEAPR